MVVQTARTRPKREISRLSLLVLLVTLSALNPMALNILMPAMPGLARGFGVDYGIVQYTLTLFLLATAVSQLFLGSLSDRLGRKPVIIGGLIAYILASFLAIWADSLGWIITARMVQAVGGAAAIALARTIIRDLYGSRKAASMLGYVTMAMVAVPMVAPWIGGQLDITYGWQSIFLFCGAAGAIVLTFTIPLLPETRPDAAKARAFLAIFKDAGSLLRNRGFVAYSGVLAFSSAMFFAYLGGAPYVVIEIMGRSQTEYGAWFALGAAGYMTGNMTSGLLADRFGPIMLIWIGTALGVIGSGLILMFSLQGDLTLLGLFGAMTLMAFSNGLTLPNTLSIVVGINPLIAGSTSGLAGFIQMFMGAVTAQVVGILLVDTALPMAVMMFVAACLSVLCVSLAGYVRLDQD